MGLSAQPDLTSQSLLRRVRQFDAGAWKRLSSLYSPVVYGWCRRAGLQDNDAADAVQEVFRSVFQNIDAFRGTSDGGSFRGWLWSITRNQVRGFFRTMSRHPEAIGGTDAQVRFSNHSDRATSEEDAEPAPEETRRRVLHRALDLVRGDFSEQTWQIFTRVTMQGHSPLEIARELGISDTSVRQAKFRVLRRLREELDGLL